MLLYVTHKPDPRPALICETAAHIDEGVIDQLKQRMLGMGCANGLLFDAEVCVIVRDTYRSLEVDSIKEDGRVPTDQLLARVRGGGRALDQRVLDWLQSMAANWDTALPLDGNVAASFIADIVPAVSGSTIREVA